MSELDEVYDPATLAAIDGSTLPREPSPSAIPSAGWRRGAATAGVLSGLALGLREVFEEEVDEEPVLQMELPSPDLRAPVVVHLVPFDPRASVAVVRPWLLAAARRSP